MATRSLPMLEVTPALVRAAAGSAADTDPRVVEFLVEDQVLPRFHVWTLGCQMNQSDSEEMAGALLAAGCAEAPGLDVR